MRLTFTKISLLCALGIALGVAVFTYVHSVEADPHAQPQPPVINISTPNCDYEKVFQSAGQQENIEVLILDDEFVEQETRVRISCVFDLTLSTDGSLNFESGLISWKIIQDKSFFRPHGGSREEFELSEANSQLPVGRGGNVDFVLEGWTPRASDFEEDRWGYNRELHTEISFTLLEMEATVPGDSQFAQAPIILKAASPAYIAAIRDVNNCTEGAICEEANRLLTEGLPEQSSRVAKLNDSGASIWEILLWIALFVLGFIVAGLAIFILHKLEILNWGPIDEESGPTSIT